MVASTLGWTAAPSDFEAIVRSSNFNTVIGSAEAEVGERLRAVESRLTPHLGAEGAVKQMAEYSGANAVGIPDQVIERMLQLKSLGLGYAIHYFPEAAYDRSGIELFEREVMPSLR